MNNPQIQEIINKCAGFIKDKAGADKLQAIILIGSFARGEGIAGKDSSGLRFSSDIEFWAVAKSYEFRNVKRACGKAMESQLKEHLSLEGSGLQLSIGVTTKKHLKNLKPYIFVVEAKLHGKVVWGDKEVLNLIPEFGFTDIVPVDGFVLLNNRIVEQLILLHKIKQGRTILHYEICKGYIQLVNSVLVFNKRYTGTYQQKITEFIRIFPSIAYLKNTIPDFPERARAAFDKINQMPVDGLAAENAMEQWTILKEYFKAVWTYETAGLLKDASHTFANLIDKFISIPTLQERIKGVVKTITHCTFRLSILKYIASPSAQYDIYQQAVKAYFYGETDMDTIRRIIADWEILVK